MGCCESVDGADESGSSPWLIEYAVEAEATAVLVLVRSSSLFPISHFTPRDSPLLRVTIRPAQLGTPSAASRSVPQALHPFLATSKSSISEAI